MALAIVNYPFWLLGRANDFPLDHFYIHWFLDLSLVTVILHLLGGIELPCGFATYMVMILTSAVFLSKKASFIVATGSMMFFDMLVWSEHIGWVPHRSDIWDHHYSLAAQVIIVIASNVFYYLFALLAGSLSEELKKANAALAEAQEGLQQHNRTLENSVRERTAALEEKNREIGEVVHIVTHDLRNVSIGAAELARRLLASERPSLSERGYRYARSLLEDTRNMNAMLTHLLALFKVDHDREQMEAVNMSGLAAEVVGSNERRITEKGIEVCIGKLPVVAADPVKMRHVLANLVDNAVKYCGDKEKPEVWIGCDEAADEYRFYVRDNGIGISADQMKRVFQLYHRGPDQIVNGVRQEGEGVGLAITKRIVERWGGRIWIVSEARKGSTVYFTCRKGSGVSAKCGETPRAGKNA